MRHLLEELQVLDGGGRLVRQAAKTLMKVGVVDGGAGGVGGEVGGDHAEELARGEQGGDHRRRDVGRLHERPELRILDDGSVQDHHLVTADHPLDQGIVDLDSEGPVVGPVRTVPHVDLGSR